MTSIHVFGRQIYDSDNQFFFQGKYTLPLDGALRDSELWQESGDIASLEDLAALPNLTVLSLYRQNIEDLAPLKGRKLKQLGIGLNPVKDLSPLKNCKTLETLNLCGLTFENPEVLATLTRLKALDVSSTNFDTLALLVDLPLENLNLMDAPFVDEITFERMPHLKRLTLGQLRPEVAGHLGALPLETLTVTHAQGVSPRDLEGLTGLKQLSFRTEERLTLTGAPLHFQALESLELKGVRLESLACLSGLGGLQSLGIYESECLDYSGLEGLTALELIRANGGQIAALEAHYPAHPWALEET